MKKGNEEYKNLLLTKSDSKNPSDIFYKKEQKMNTEKWNNSSFSILERAASGLPFFLCGRRRKKFIFWDV